MVGLVDEIQRDALDGSVSISALLRKVRLAAAKLQLPTVEDWVEHELNGYTGEVPAYRRLHGTPRVLNPYQGWIPITGSNKYMEWLSNAPIKQAVGALSDLLGHGKGQMTIALSHDIIRSLNKANETDFGEAAVFLDRASVANILERVRTMILDWAIELEKNGIRGEGMTFDMNEKKAARESSVIHIGTMTGSIGDHNSIGNIVGGNFNVQEVSNLAHQLQSNMPALMDAGVNGPALQKATSGLIAEIGKAAPDEGVITGLLGDARNALSGAAGNLLASGAVALIAALLPGVAG